MVIIMFGYYYVISCSLFILELNHQILNASL